MPSIRPRPTSTRPAAAARCITPATRSVDPQLLFDEDLHQPYVDEFAVGFNRQFPGQISIDVAATQRRFNDNFGEVDINGIYPSGPDQPFVGFGLVDPNRGIIMQRDQQPPGRR